MKWTANEIDSYNYCVRKLLFLLENCCSTMLVNKAPNERKSVVLQGDFNDILNQDSHECTEFLEADCDLFQQIGDPTYVTDHGQSLLYHVYVSKPDQVLKNGVINYSISDHFPTFLSLRLQAPPTASGRRDHPIPPYEEF